MKHLLLVFSFLGFIFSLHAQTPPSFNSADILLGIEKLNTTAAVLYIAAHPDDENTRLLAYLAKEKKLRTGYLSLTRGDGGQNLIGKEQGDPLGLIRTQELLAARRMDGAEQFFTRANDFGFSKNPEETFSIWNKDSILSDVVWTIRRFRPDVIICRFPTTGEGGHGHHTASAILALEAFDAAADPNRFPEQLAYTQVWQAKRIFWNTFNFGGNNTTAPDQLKIDVGSYNPLLGKSYGEIAAESRSNHKSQGFGSAKGRGASIEYFKLLKGSPVQTDLFDGIDQSWKRCNEKTVQELIESCIRNFNPRSPELSVPKLADIYRELAKKSDNPSPDRTYWTSQKLKETETLLLACSGIWLEASANDFSGIPGNKIGISSQIIMRNKAEAKLEKISYWQQSDTVPALSLKTNELITYKHSELIPVDLPFSTPYWLIEKHGVPNFVVRNRLLIGNPENEASLKITFSIEIGGLHLQIERPLVYKATDPVKGEVYRPFEILPPATVNISEKAYVFSTPGAKTIQLTIKSNAPDIHGSIQLKAPEGWNVQIKNAAFSLAAKGDETIVEASITPGKNAGIGKLQASLLINEQEYSKSIRRIEYDHIPYQFILSDAEAGLVNVQLRKAGTLVAYIPGAGDDVPAALKQIGYTVTILTDELLSTENLSKYNAIITGVRAYNTSHRLQQNYARLMEYVKNGGNLIVQYNTNNQLGGLTAKIGPYPFTISRDRVTNENASVTFLNPKSPALTFPNQISSADFEGWIQERGIYFAKDWDKNYEPVLSMSDPNEKAAEGSLLIGKYGKGNFVYTGLVFFRELPAGIPGAYRLFVNLISLPQHAPAGLPAALPAVKAQ
jgi:LmbE family N-acetylglucosaminyl deacetylase